ncbi:unnamed protein product [Symbiodinium pilosum]|uniref:Uncharacterized protein n=1 Tax=Symbiodinium pilosum TaxID=2952 RepID=A0A812W328_SYMPI|nr:unnamed protein product [Symbiodinium pilosum]
MSGKFVRGEGFEALEAQSSDDSFEAQRVTRNIDPEESDIYVDALFAPLYRKMERIQQDGTPRPRIKDYMVVTPFLVINFLVQSGISLKVLGIANKSYDDTAGKLFGDDELCQTIHNNSNFYGNLWPVELQAAMGQFETGFDCGQRLVTWSMYPQLLDFNGDKLWSISEADEKTRQLTNAGLTPPGGEGGIRRALLRMISDDLAKSQKGGYVTRSQKGSHLDLEWFARNRQKLKVCVVADKHLCGNLESNDKFNVLKDAFPDLDEDERPMACKGLEKKFCRRIFGQQYYGVYLHTQKVCGTAEFEADTQGIQVAEYENVDTFIGESDSVNSSDFVILLTMLLLIWGMIMLQEFRAIRNLVIVLWLFPSTRNSDRDFAVIEEGKMKVVAIPFLHKCFSWVMCLLRAALAVFIFYVGLRFLSTTSSLLDLILNSTALGFLIEVDAFISAAFLGETFRSTVKDHCDVIQVDSGAAPGIWIYAVPPLILIAVLGPWLYYTYYSEWGLRNIARAMQCLCHAEGQCLATQILKS